MKKSRRIVTLMLALVLCLTTVLAVPVAAASKSSGISKKCRKAYQALLKAGEFTYSSTYKYWSWYDYDGTYTYVEPEKRVYKWYTTKTPETYTYKITGFRVLNIDQKGQPELVLRVVRQTSAAVKNAAGTVTQAAQYSEYPDVVVAYYKGGKVRYATSQSSPTNITPSDYTKHSLTYDYDHVKYSSRQIDAQNSNAYKTLNKFYYSKSKKALYNYSSTTEKEYSYKDYTYVSYDKPYTNVKLDYSYTYKSVSRTFYKLSGGKLVPSKYAYEYTNTGSGSQDYEIQTGTYKYSEYSVKSSEYKKYVKKNFKGIKGYSFYALTAKNISKKVK